MKKYVFIFTISAMLFSFNIQALKTIYHTPYCHYHLKLCEPYFNELGYTLKKTNSPYNLSNFDYLIIMDRLPAKKLPYPKEKIIFFLQEPPIFWPKSYEKCSHDQFGKVITWRDDWIDNKKYFKIYHPQLRNLREKREAIDFNEKKLCLMINTYWKNSNKNELYSKRIDTIAFFADNAPHDFDLYGLWWAKWRKNIPFYKGTISGTTSENSEHKLDVLSKYKFCICYENCKNISGYITEKIFDCLRARCVPIYYGASNITDVIPSNCFIERQKFKNDNELYHYIKSMTREEHESYINAIDDYLTNDPRIDYFNLRYFVGSVVRAIEA